MEDVLKTIASACGLLLPYLFYYSKTSKLDKLESKELFERHLIFLKNELDDSLLNKEDRIKLPSAKEIKFIQKRLFQKRIDDVIVYTDEALGKDDSFFIINASSLISEGQRIRHVDQDKVRKLNEIFLQILVKETNQASSRRLNGLSLVKFNMVLLSAIRIRTRQVYQNLVTLLASGNPGIYSSKLLLIEEIAKKSNLRLKKSPDPEDESIQWLRTQITEMQ